MLTITICGGYFFFFGECIDLSIFADCGNCIDLNIFADCGNCIVDLSILLIVEIVLLI